MSENQQPLTEEQTEPVQSTPEEPGTSPAETEAESSMLPAETDDNELVETTGEDTEEEEEDIDPADVKIFGMPRRVFHFTAFGVAIGYILAGLIGMAGFNPPNATVCAIVCAAIGYVIGRQRYKKRQAERESTQADAENNAE